MDPLTNSIKYVAHKLQHSTGQTLQVILVTSQRFQMLGNIQKALYIWSHWLPGDHSDPAFIYVVTLPPSQKHQQKPKPKSYFLGFEIFSVTGQKVEAFTSALYLGFWDRHIWEFFLLGVFTHQSQLSAGLVLNKLIFIQSKNIKYNHIAALANLKFANHKRKRIEYKNKPTSEKI